MSWRIAESLKKLREQINAAYPLRDKASDGGIGDAAHASRNSDHNPWVKDARGMGVVTAIDIDEDLARDIHSIQFMVDSIIASRDPRVKYIIYEGRMISSYPARGYGAWKWRPYAGTKNPHRLHAHISVNPSPYHYDNRAEWNIGSAPLKDAEAAKPLLEISPIEKPASEFVPRESTATEPAAAESSEAQPPPPPTQNAENITNVQTGGGPSVPPDFKPENKTVDAPPAEGSTATATKMTIAGFAVPTFLVSFFAAIKSAYEQGFINAAQVGEVAINFISQNTGYVFAGLGLVVGGMMLKKLYKQVTLWLSMYFAARADMHNVTVKPQ